MPTITLPATSAQFTSLRTQLAASGIIVPDGNTGTITGHGITASYTFDGKSLVVTAVSKTGWLPTWSQVFDDIQDHLNASA